MTITRRSALKSIFAAIIAVPAGLRRVATAGKPSREPAMLPAPSDAPPASTASTARVCRVLLPMSSGVHILPNTTVQITSRPMNVAFRPERLIISGTPGDWIVNDIKVENRSQFSQSGDVPGEVFASTATDRFVGFDVVRVGKDFTVNVTYVGAAIEGAPFVCAVLGTPDELLSPA